MRIPESWADRQGNDTLYFERLEPEFTHETLINRQKITLLYEKPSEGFSYGCSPADITHIFSSVASNGFRFPDIVAFRQPTRKQKQQLPIWGRFAYYSEIGKYTGTAIILEAQEIEKQFSWPRKLSHDSQAELRRLKADGHVFRETKRAHVYKVSKDSLRNTLLYRTLLHELGHYVHYQIDVLNSATRLSDDEFDAANYHFAKPSLEKEKFAHRFAEELAEKLRRDGVIPFLPMSIDGIFAI